MKPDQERVKQMLTETILLLCKNGLHFQKQMTVQGLLGVTLDNTDIFMIHLNEVIQPEKANLNTGATEVCAEIPTLSKTSAAFQSDSPIISDITCTRRDNISNASTLMGYSRIDDNPENGVHVKSEPADHSIEILDNNSEGVSQSNTWPGGYSSGLGPAEDSTCLEDSDECLMTFDTVPLSMERREERLLSGQHYSSLGTEQYDDDDFQNDSVSHGSRHNLQNPLGLNSDDFVSTHNPAQSRLTSRPSHRSYSLANQFPTSHFFMSRYRPKNSSDKEYHCTYPDCKLSFYARRTLLRHQTQKHGRPKSYVRYASKPYSLSSMQYGRSRDGH